MYGLDSLNELTKPTKPLIKISDTDKSKKEKAKTGAMGLWNDKAVERISVGKQKQYTIDIENMYTKN